MKICGIILAAGASSRMGATKQLMPFGNTTLLGRVVQQATASRLHEVIVVLGHDAVRIMDSVDLSGTRIVKNPAYRHGQSTSIKKGIEALSSPCTAAMFLLGDQPFVTTAIIDKLIKSYQTAHRPIAIPYHNGKRGNPVIIARSLFDRLNSLSGDVGARTLFGEYRTSILRVNISDPAVVRDIDTRKDYEKLIIEKKINC